MDLTLSDMMRVFKRWKWLFLVTVAITPILVIAVYKYLPKEYEVSAVVKVEGTKSTGFSFGGISIPVSSGGNVDDYIEIMRSRKIVEGVIKKLALVGRILGKKDIERYERMGYTQDDLVEIAYRVVMKNLDISTLGKSSLISVSYKSKDPKLGYDLISSIIKEFKSTVETMASQSIQKKLEFLDEKREKTYEKFRKKLSELVEFQRKNGVISLEDELLNLKTIEYQLMTSLVASGTALSEAKEETNQLFKELATTPVYRDFQTVTNLNNEINDLESQLAALRAIYLDSYVKVKETKAQIESLKLKLETAKKSLLENPISFSTLGEKIVKNLWGIRNLETKLSVGRKVLEEVEGDINRLLGLEEDYTEIKTDLEVYKNLLTFIWQQQIQTMLSQLSSVYPVTVVSPPEYTHVPKQASTLFLGMVGISIGLFLGILLVFWRESSYPNVTDHIIFSKELGIENFYTIRLRHLEDSQKIASDLRRFTGRVLVGGPSNGEGKSEITLRLAETFSSLGKKVLLVDGDIDKKTLSSKLKFATSRGLSNGILTPVIVKDLFFIPAGTGVNISEVSIPNDYDIVLIDSPSYEIRMMDFSLLLDSSDALLLVISEMVSNKMVTREMLKKFSDKIFGVVFNKVRWLA